MSATRTWFGDKGSLDPKALQQLLDSAVESICSRQKQNLDDAVSTLQAKIVHLERALTLSQGAENLSGDAGLITDGCTSPTRKSTRRGRSNRLFADLLSNAKIGSHRDSAPRPEAVDVDTQARGGEEGDLDCVRSSSSQSQCGCGYSAAEMVELLSGGDSAFHEVRSSRSMIGSILFVLVIVSVVASTLALGVSMDVHPQSSFWIVLEFVCVSVFVTEFVFKLAYSERMAYFFGPIKSFSSADSYSGVSLRRWNKLPRRDQSAWINSFWNWFDFLITVIAVVDIIVALGGFASRARSWSMLRCFRFFRALRLVKLLRVPVVRDLMNIFYGLILGTPLLVGAFCMLALTVYLSAILFRTFFGPTFQVEERCPFDKDMSVETFSMECPSHEYYAYRYFGTVDEAMFTLFRCMTLDCSTSDGNSLIVILSKGYGLPFNIAWSSLTTWVVCGILNIIMASYVGKASANIEFRDSGVVRNWLRKLAKALVEYSNAKFGPRRSNTNHSGMSEASTAIEETEQWPRRGEICFSKADFVELLDGKDPRSRRVRRCIRELGLNIASTDLFNVLDMDESGSIDAVEIIDSLMMLSNIKTSGTTTTLIALHGLSAKLNDMALDTKLHPQRNQLETQPRELSVTEKNWKIRL